MILKKNGYVHVTRLWNPSMSENSFKLKAQLAKSLVGSNIQPEKEGQQLCATPFSKWVCITSMHDNYTKHLI